MPLNQIQWEVWYCLCHKDKFLTERILHYLAAQTRGFFFLWHFAGCSRFFFQLDVIAIMSGYIFHPAANSMTARKRLKYEGNACVWKTCHNWKKVKNCIYLALSKTKMQLEDMWRPEALCTLWLPWKTQQINGHVCFKQIMTKTKTFPLRQNLTCANNRVYVATCKVVRYAINNMLSTQ